MTASHIRPEHRDLYYCFCVWSGGKAPELCLTMAIVEGYLEVHVMAARNIPRLAGLLLAGPAR